MGAEYCATKGETYRDILIRPYIRMQSGRTFGLPLILGIVIGAALVIFALQNTAVTTITFMSSTLSLPLALLVTDALALGALAAILAMIPGFIKNERSIKRLKADKKATEDELATYRVVIPLAPPEQNGIQIPVYVRPLANSQRYILIKSKSAATLCVAAFRFPQHIKNTTSPYYVIF